MASSYLLMFNMPTFFILFSLFFIQNNGVVGCYTSIFSFGDSLADTGNFIFSAEESHAYGSLPYGETYFQEATGRCSDGRLVIDFIAQALGLSFIPPFLGHTTQDFGQGVNFAVAGATAIGVPFLEKGGVQVLTNYSLGVQLEWFKQVLPSLCSSPSECRTMLRSALFLVGEIGGNDYNDPFFQGKSVAETRPLVPKVIDVISSTITALIDEGAATLVVPGNLPFGCAPVYLRLFASQNEDDYDPSTGCLNWCNEFSQFHNDLLQKELNRLRELHPHATIIYADYYNVAMELYRFPNELGFKKGALTACCGGGGVHCGDEGFTVCDDPSMYVSWDGVHMTEAAYKWIATGILKGPFTIPAISISCISSKPHNINTW